MPHFWLYRKPESQKARMYSMVLCLGMSVPGHEAWPGTLKFHLRKNTGAERTLRPTGRGARSCKYFGTTNFMKYLPRLGVTPKRQLKVSAKFLISRDL